MADRYALVRGSTVENVIEWDGGDQWSPPDGVLLIRLDLRRNDHKACSPGSGYTNGAFTSAPPQEQPPLPKDLTALIQAMVQEGIIPTNKVDALTVNLRANLRK